MKSDLKLLRKTLQNPYAFIERLEEDDECGSMAGARKVDQLSASRRYTRRGISEIVGALQRRLWAERRTLLSREVENPIELLDPEIALNLVGFRFLTVDGLGEIPTNDGRRIEAAGMIDRERRVVKIATRFAPRVQRFTAAHELAHAVLHPSAGGVHRDIPVDGPTQNREPDEIEANQFASEFLMPAKLVRARFSHIFRRVPFIIDQQTSLALGLGTESVARKRLSSLRRLSVYLASAEHFDGLHFGSLAAQFRVSEIAMAIRLEELGLVSM